MLLVLLGLAYKECGTDGMWFKHPDTNRSWSNYTTCVNQIDFEVNLDIYINYTKYRNMNYVSIKFQLIVIDLTFNYILGYGGADFFFVLYFNFSGVNK